MPQDLTDAHWFRQWFGVARQQAIPEPIKARINSWIELELIINSIQFSMNWIGIELKDFELEENWNWKAELIRIDQFNQFIFNSTPHFTRFDIFFYDIWKLQCDKQWLQWLNKHIHMLHCVPQNGVCTGLWTWKVDHFINYFWDISNGLTHSVLVTYKYDKLISHFWCHIASDNILLIIWLTLVQIKMVCHLIVPYHYFNQC